MTVQQFDYRDGDTLLQAGIAFPAGAQKAPAVLIVHQWAGRGEGCAILVHNVSRI